MEEGTEKYGKDREDIFSKSVKAGKRTYFFDVKTTRGNEHYLTITESKKRFDDSGKFSFEKHKIFLYKEDFESFTESLLEAIGHVKSVSPPIEPRRKYDPEIDSTNSLKSSSSSSNDFTDVNFEDLDK